MVGLIALTTTVVPLLSLPVQDYNHVLGNDELEGQSYEAHI